jgi:hypothetical protein
MYDYTGVEDLGARPFGYLLRLIKDRTLGEKLFLL